MSRRFSYLIILCLTFALTATGMGQPGHGSVAGQVRDPDQRFVQGATVLLLPLQVETLTDAEGRFRLDGLPPGIYSLKVSLAGFQPVMESRIEVHPGSTAWRDVRFVNLQLPQTIQVDVVGVSAEALKQIPGSAFVVTQEDLQRGAPMDSNEVLRRVPGVFLREDSGPVSMRLNMGIRGLDPTRSRQLLVLEDGVPLALGPYGEPEMYYTPPIDRMQRIEVLKGSGSILFGPQTVGGVVNFVTPDPPLRPQGSAELVAGQREFLLGKVGYGGTMGNVGAYISLLHKQGDGFRDFYFKINDLTSKLLFTLSDRQRLALKLNYYDESSNSTYLGLTQPMFEKDPHQNPVPHDRLKVFRYSASATHQYFLGNGAMLSTTVYGYTTTRNWRRQDFDRSDRGARYLAVVGDPTIQGGALYLKNSSGNRNREFQVVGIEPRLQVGHRLLGLTHKLETGVRFHLERAFEKRIDGNRFDSPTGTIREDEIRTGHAFAGFVQNRVFLTERLVLTPGLRLERFSYDRHILRKRVNGVPTDVDIRQHTNSFALIPGIGLSYDAAGRFTLFTGLHRGFAPPRIKDAINSSGEDVQLDAELSWNYELGARFKPRSWTYGELTFFVLDFQNQIIPASEAGGAVSTLTNAGETLHRGVEGLLGFDWAQLLGLRSSLVSEIRYTHLPTAGFASGKFQGNRLPYAPENLLTLLFGYTHPQGFRLQLDGSYVDEHFSDKENRRLGSTDGTVGLLPSYLVWNLTASYYLPALNVTPFVTIKNLTNELYIASRAPEGIQPGLFRQVNFGLRIGF